MKLEIKQLYPITKQSTCDKTGEYLANLYKVNHYYNKRSLCFIWNAGTPQKMMDSLRDQKMLVLVALLNNKCIGFITFHDCGDHDDDNRQMQIFMMPRWKHKGLGAPCLILAEKYLTKKQKYVRTLTAIPCNDAIRSLLDKCGWQDCCEYCGDYKKYLTKKVIDN